MLLKDRVAFITGSASGIGLAVGTEFLKNGAKVVFVDLNEEKVQTVVEDFKKQGYDCLGLTAQVNDEQQLVTALDKAMEKYGRLEILFNNAGLQHVSMLEDFPTEKFRYMLDVMVMAPFIATKYVMPIMKKQEYGRILNMGSINGVIGFAGKSAYNSAKHAIVGLTKVTALEGAPFGITANAICPGYCDTPLVRGQFEDLSKTRGVPLESVKEDVLYPLVPQRRLIDTQEIADYATFLVSDKAKAITGQACLIDAGYTCQ